MYSTLLELKSPWKVEIVFLDSVKKTVEIYIAHRKGSKLLCPICRKECMVYDHLRERVWRDLDSNELMTVNAGQDLWKIAGIKMIHFI